MKTTLIALGAGIIIVLAGGGLYLLNDNTQTQPAKEPLPKKQLTPTTTETPTPSPTETLTVTDTPSPSPTSAPQISPVKQTNNNMSFPPQGAPAVPQGSTPFFGEISSKTDTTITVKQPWGEVTAAITSSTQFQGGSQSDLTVGTKISGIGSKNSDGTITATQITINPTKSGAGAH